MLLCKIFKTERSAMLLLSNDEVAGLLTIEDCTQAIEDVYKELAGKEIPTEWFLQDIRD